MKLISCHIENYGRISGAEFSFNGELSAFCEKNGYGKTTLASFLKAMFYGLDSDRANSGFNDRRHFCPFSGGSFGGNVVFEAAGKTYKIERSFDEKSEAKDSLTVYCNGKLFSCDGEEPGKKFFGIDRQSFERTAFISGADVEISSTGSINKKLNNFVEGDDTDFEAALARLEAKKKEYKKLRGGDGLISCEKNRLNILSEEISNKNVIAAGLPQKYAEYEEKSREISALTEEISAAQSQNVVFANWESYDRTVADNALNRERMTRIEGNYPFGIPSGAETDGVKKASEEFRTCSARLSQKSFTEEDGARYSALKEKFSEGVPAEAVIGKIGDCVAEERKCAFDLKALGETELSDKEKLLMQKFAYRAPAPAEIERLKLNSERYKAAEAECAKIPDFVTSEEYCAAGQPKINKKLCLAIATVSALCAAGGVAAAFFIMALGIALVAAGVSGLMVSGFIYLSAKSAKPGELKSVQKENPEKLAAKKKAEEIYADIQACLLPYGYTLEHGVPYAVASFSDDVDSFNGLKEKSERDKARAEELSLKKRALDEKIEAFFAGYGIFGGDYDERTAKLRTDIGTLSDLKKRKESWEKTEEAIRAEIEKSRGVILAFCEKYKFPPEQIDGKIKLIEKDRADYALFGKILAEGEKKAEDFKADKGLKDRPEDSAADIEELNARLAELQEDKNRLYTEITADESDAGKLCELRSEYERTRSKLEKYKADYELLCKAADSLSRADRTLKDKYIKPVRDRFLFYSASLEKALGEKIVMNSDFEIRYERGGKERSERHLSSGLRSLCALCFRLALIDNMYSEEKPFVILDDPFMSLDEEHMEKAKVLLKAISGRIQIIYFSCHASRAI